MLDLITQFTIPQIITFIVLFALVIKGGWDLIDFFIKKYKDKFNKDYEKKTKQEELDKHFDACIKQHEETLNIYGMLEKKLDGISNTMEEKFDVLEKRMDQLDENDKHSIKQTIVKDYHYFVEKQGQIDDFSLDSILLLYEDYKKLGGNSYVSTLVDAIKRLPNTPPG